MDINGYPWISMDSHGYPKISMYIHGHPWIYMDIFGDVWIPMDVLGHPSTSMDIDGYPWISIMICSSVTSAAVSWSFIGCIKEEVEELYNNHMPECQHGAISRGGTDLAHLLIPTAIDYATASNQCIIILFQHSRFIKSLMEIHCQSKIIDHLSMIIGFRPITIDNWSVINDQWSMTSDHWIVNQ